MNSPSHFLMLRSSVKRAVKYLLPGVGVIVFLSCYCTVVARAESKGTTDVKAQHNIYVQQYLRQIEAEARSGSAQTYYNTSYYLNGMISAVEATNNADELAKLIALIDTMIVAAKDLNGDGKLEWGSDNPAIAPLDVNKRPWQLNTFQPAIPIARTAAYLLNNSAFRKKYEAKALQYVDYIDNNILKYWFDKDHGVYSAPRGKSWTFKAGRIPWADKSEGGAGGDEAWSDKASLVGAMAAAMYAATKDPFHREIAERIGRSFKARLKVAGTGWVWDADLPMSYWTRRFGYGSDYEPAHDTSHCNREPMMMVLMYEAGLVFSRDDLQRLADTLLETIWNGSLDNPMFANYINGSNKPYIGTKEAGGVGNVYAGWCLLGRYSPRLQLVLRTTLSSIVNGKTIGQNYTPYGKVALSGHLLRNEM